MGATSVHMKMSKVKQPTMPMRRGAAYPVMTKDTTIRVSGLCTLALGAVLVCYPSSIPAADVLPSTDLASGTAPAVKPSSEPRGHQMRRYQSFAQQAELPPVSIVSKSTFVLGTTVKMHTCRLAQMPASDMDTLASQFAVPTAVIAKVVQKVSGTLAPSAAEFAESLRTAVIDYRFLRGEWDRYHPPQEGLPTKNDALQALQAGDVAKAWALYDSLGIPPAPAAAPPQPPGNLHVVSGP
jgi:hypothetical protein